METSTRLSIKIIPYDETFVFLDAEPGVLQHLMDRYTYKAKDYKFTKRYKLGSWDGTIKVFNPSKKLFYRGLLNSLEQFATQHGYHLDWSKFPNKKPSPIKSSDIREFSKTLHLTAHGKPIEMFDHQVKACWIAINEQRCVIESPTSSGKSLSIFVLTKWFSDKKILVVVPTKTLVEQLFSDFEDYQHQHQHQHQHGDPATSNEFGKVHGNIKQFDKRVVISTWQSLVKKDRTFFEQFDALIIDECHHAQSVSIKNIAEKCINASIRIGFTGTLDRDKLKRCTITGVLGPEQKIITTAKLMEQNLVAKMKIHCLILEHTKANKQKMETMDFQKKISTLAGNFERNLAISKLACSKPNKNVLVLFSLVKQHGELLQQICTELLEGTDRKVFFVHGGVSAEERERIRKEMEQSTGNVLIASYGTMSTGTSIRNLHCGIFATVFKSRIRNLQSIGRLLRQTDGNKESILYDIADDATITDKNNHTMKHFAERLKIYKKEQFKFKITTKQLTGEWDD